MKQWYAEVACPECGSVDVDLAEVPDGPVFACQECGAQFEPLAGKPPCPLVGTDGNVFAVIGTVKRCLQRAGQHAQAEAWVAAAMASTSYDEVIQQTFNFVDPM